MKALTHVITFYANALKAITPFLLAPFVISFACMILTTNNFIFNDQHYLQIHGTAMGTKMAPFFANLFLGLFEQQCSL